MLSDSDFVGYAATVTTCATLFPQIVKVVKTKSGEDLSYTMLLLNTASNILWGTYGILENRLPMIIAGSITLTSALSLLAFKYAYRKTETPLQYIQSTAYIP